MLGGCQLAAIQKCGLKIHKKHSQVIDHQQATEYCVVLCKSLAGNNSLVPVVRSRRHTLHL